VSGLSTLLGKEIREILRTSRIYVIPGLFLFFGLTSPILTKLMPELLKSFGGSAGGIEIVIPPQTAVDAFAQFFKNLTQIGILAVILTTMGAVADEKTRGTVLLVVTKPVARVSVVVAKFLAGGLVVVFGTALGYVAALYYTVHLFPDVPVAASLRAATVFAVYVVFIVALTVWASTVMRSQVAAAGVALAGFVTAGILPSLSPVLARWTPGGLVGLTGRMFAANASLGDAGATIAVSLVVSLLLVAAAGWSLGRQEL